MPPGRSSIVLARAGRASAAADPLARAFARLAEKAADLLVDVVGRGGPGRSPKCAMSEVGSDLGIGASPDPFADAARRIGSDKPVAVAGDNQGRCAYFGERCGHVAVKRRRDVVRT